VERPSFVKITAPLLCVAGLVAFLAGIGLSWASSCCGSSDPADGKPALIGFLILVIYVTAGFLLWTGLTNRAVVAVLTGAIPVALGLTSAASSDAGGLFIPLVVVWVGFCWSLRAPVVGQWFRSQRVGAEPPRA
jgi:hypothetical protein